MDDDAAARSTTPTPIRRTHPTHATDPHADPRDSLTLAVSPWGQGCRELDMGARCDDGEPTEEVDPVTTTLAPLPSEVLVTGPVHDGDSAVDAEDHDNAKAIHRAATGSR